MLSVIMPAHADIFKKDDGTKAIKQVLQLQNKYAQKHNLKGLMSLYSNDFKSDDGYTRDVYFKLIEDTWKSYTDISYDYDIKDIKITGDTAQADVYETALATATQIEDGLTIYGELKSYSNGIYTFQKVNNKWLISGEKLKDEKSYLKYGDTRFVEMDLKSPEKVKPGEYYTSALTVEPPENSMFVASINREKITYPQESPEDVFRKLPQDNILERMFYANKDGKNEYNVATIGMSKTEKIDENRVKFYMAGLAFIMTRVNVGEENEQNQ